MVEDLIILESNGPRLPGRDGIDPSPWREHLQPFTGVKILYLSQCLEIAPRIALVLQELVGESVLELLPVLQNIFLENMQPSELVLVDPELKGIEEFVVARQLASHPISISRWKRGDVYAMTKRYHILDY